MRAPHRRGGRRSQPPRRTAFARRGCDLGSASSARHPTMKAGHAAATAIVAPARQVAPRDGRELRARGAAAALASALAAVRGGAGGTDWQARRERNAQGPRAIARDGDSWAGSCSKRWWRCSSRSPSSGGRWAPRRKPPPSTERKARSVKRARHRQRERRNRRVERRAVLGAHLVGAAHRAHGRRDRAPLVYSKLSPGFSSGCCPTTPRPLTSWTLCSASVMIQCRLTSCAATSPVLVIVIV